MIIYILYSSGLVDFLATQNMMTKWTSAWAQKWNLNIQLGLFVQLKGHGFYAVKYVSCVSYFD